jgi:glyoxylase-like metal-dependent hydrolase (beta-lactamase superfamily II)
MTGSPERPCDSAVEAVTEDVFRIGLPLPNDPLREVNVYAIRDGQGLTLIDGGWALDECFAALEKAVDSIGYDLAAISRFLVTHIHRDHFTLALRVRRLFGAKVAIGIGERPSFGQLQAGRHDGPFRLLQRWGAATLAASLTPDEGRGPESEPYAEPDEWIEGPADVVLPSGRTLSAIPTPGHTNGHVVYVDISAGLLFAGDHVLPSITPSIGYEPVRPPHPLRDYLQSLERILLLPDLRLLPAHGPVTRSSHERAQQLREHHETRLAATLAALDPAGSSAYEVARRLAWTRRSRSFEELDGLNRALAVSETAAHLDVLIARGLLQARQEGGADVYKPMQPSGTDGELQTPAHQRPAPREPT